MISFAARRWIALALTIAGGAAIVAAVSAAYPQRPDAAAFTGWCLTAMVLFLALLNLRKKLPYPPLLSSAAWVQVHIYVGLLSILVFVLHAGLDLPDGPFETTLAVVFTLVAASGVAGLLLSRIVPRRLSARGEEVLFERVASFRRLLMEQAERLVLASAAESETPMLAHFYQRRLALYFQRPRHLLAHVLQSSRSRRRLSAELTALQRYLSEAERQEAAELAQLIAAKDDLDYQYANQGLLKAWLFVHIPLTYVLIIMLAVHIVLVHGFAGR